MVCSSSSSDLQEFLLVPLSVSNAVSSSKISQPKRLVKAVSETDPSYFVTAAVFPFIHSDLHPARVVESLSPSLYLNIEEKLQDSYVSLDFFLFFLSLQMRCQYH